MRSNLIDLLGSLGTLASTAFLIALYMKAYADTRTTLKLHLDVMERWLEGPSAGDRGWRIEQVTTDHLIAWLDPSQTIFPLVSGPALIEIATAETLTLGKRLTHRVIALNQGIESFNATLEKVESFRVTHAATLSRVHALAARRRAEPPRPIDPQEPGRFLEVLGTDVDTGDRALATILVRLAIGLHVDRIGNPESEGLCGECTRTRVMMRYAIHPARSAARLDATGQRPAAGQSPGR